MSKKRLIEIYSADCPLCRSAIDRIRQIACPSCEVVVRDIADPEFAVRANILGARSVPAITIDGRLAECSVGGGFDEEVLRAAGVGQPL